jgi:imidazole glycerol-phosphate synthase subunit HisH
MMITIIDYQFGNLASVKNMLHRNGVESKISRDPEEIRSSERVILPGVGSFDAAVKSLMENHITEALRDFVKSGRKLLGICLGAQLLLNGSEEGTMEGLGFIAGRSERFKPGEIEPLKIPHMGWSEVTFKPHSLAVIGERTPPRFYFVHSYHMVPESPKAILASAVYTKTFTCGIVHENVAGFQFHPEKSHRNGAQLLRNFAAW